MSMLCITCSKFTVIGQFQGCSHNYLDKLCSASQISLFLLIKCMLNVSAF